MKLRFFLLNIDQTKQTMPFFKPKSYGLPRSRQIENSTKRNGLRHTIFNTVGDRYIGEWKDDKKNGKGIILTRNDEIYEGDIKDNYRHGHGVLGKLIPDTKVYKLYYRGEWRNGRMHGMGLHYFDDGSFYLGGYKRGKRHGHGQQWFPDGSFFDGEFKDDLRDGLGVLVRADGNRYEGQFKDDLKHGKGLFYHLDNGLLQDGVWHKDMCVYSQMRDLEYRQCSIDPTPYPIPQVTLMYPEKVCETAKVRALAGVLDPCEDDFFSYNKLNVASITSTLMTRSERD